MDFYCPSGLCRDYHALGPLARPFVHLHVDHLFCLNLCCEHYAGDRAPFYLYWSLAYGSGWRRVRQ